MGQNLKLELGYIESEKINGNSGIFIYWHGRLIEVYDLLLGT